MECPRCNGISRAIDKTSNVYLNAPPRGTRLACNDSPPNRTKNVVVHECGECGLEFTRYSREDVAREVGVYADPDTLQEGFALMANDYEN